MNVFHGFELVTIVCCLIAIVDAHRRKGWSRVAEVVTTIPYGWLLEVLMIRIFAEYRYGSSFALVVMGVPVAIGWMWAAVIYAVMECSARFAFPSWLRALLSASLAVVLDVVLDPIAVRLGLWTWRTPHFFGVYFGNFYGWLFIVVLYSAFLRYLRPHPLRPILAMTLSLLILPVLLAIGRATLTPLGPLVGSLPLIMVIIATMYTVAENWS